MMVLWPSQNCYRFKMKISCISDLLVLTSSCADEYYTVLFWSLIFYAVFQLSLCFQHAAGHGLCFQSSGVSSQVCAAGSAVL